MTTLRGSKLDRRHTWKCRCRTVRLHHAPRSIQPDRGRVQQRATLLGSGPVGREQAPHRPNQQERVVALAALADFALPVATIAQRTRTGRKQVSAALAASRSEAAINARRRHSSPSNRPPSSPSSTATQRTWAALSDPPSAACSTTWPSGCVTFDHLAQRMGDERAAAAGRAEIDQAARAAGLRVRPDSDGPVWELEGCCVDQAVHGHPSRWGRSPGTGPAASEAEPDARRGQRRAVLDGNKAWRSATTVRRVWLTGFAQRKSSSRSGRVGRRDHRGSLAPGAARDGTIPPSTGSASPETALTPTATSSAAGAPRSPTLGGVTVVPDLVVRSQQTRPRICPGGEASVATGTADPAGGRSR